MLMNSNEYLDLVQNIKLEIQHAQYKAALSVNRELVELYYNIGKMINAHKTWGNKFIENLAADIKLAFPDAKGYSVRNLKYMAKFAATYPDEQFVQQAVAQIPWGHIVVLLDKISDDTIRKWYVQKTAENGWSRSVLIHQIESGLYERQAITNKVSNFENRLTSPQSELAVQTMKDPYIFDFIPFKEEMVGLKTGEFKPEYAGQLNFYLSAVDGTLKKDGDNPSIGLLLCKSKNDLVAEYALKDMSKPMGVSEYRVTSNLPEDLSKQLPSVEDIQKRISNTKD